jgi:hypothetical protein
MKTLKAISVLTIALLSNYAGAQQFKNCRASLNVEKFRFADPQGRINHGGGELTSTRTQIGTVLVDLDVKNNSTVSGKVTVRDSNNNVKSSQLNCAITYQNGDTSGNDMECVSRKEFGKSIGHLIVSFNSYSAPYRVHLFTEKSNSPNGSFSTTSEYCD